MIWRLVFYLFCCLLPATAFLQPKFISEKDSMAFTMADSAFALAFKNSDAAFLLANQSLEQAVAIKSDRAEANAYTALGWTFMHKGYLDSAIVFLDKAWKIFSKLKNADDIIRADINIAEVYTKQSKISQATRHLLEADSLCASTNNVPYQTNVRRQLAIVYRESGDFKRSAGYFNQALSDFEYQKDFFRYASTGVSLSILYRNMKLPDSSLFILNKCLALAKEKSNMPYQVAMVEEHLGETYFMKKDYSSAFNHYSAAYKIFNQLNNKADLAYESFCIGRTLVKQNQFKEAERYLLTAYTINDTLKMLNYQLDASMELSSLYTKTGEWQKAYQYRYKAGELKDSINFAEQLEKTNELKEKYETVKKENEITLLKTKSQLAEAGNRRSRLLQLIFISLFVASLIIGGLMINRVKIKRRLQNQLLRNQLASDLHDDIGSALSSIDISSRIALVKKDDALTVVKHLENIQQNARKTMDSMSDIVWSINPANDDFENVLMRMREFAAEMCEPMQISLKFNVATGVENIQLDSDKRKNIFLIYKEAVNNAVKYSHCRQLVIGFTKTGNHQVEMTIKDDGAGFDEDLVKKGNGLNNMAARAAQLNGKLLVQSKPQQGTIIILHWPV